MIWAFEDIATCGRPRTLSPDTFTAGHRAVGTGFESVITFATDFSTGRSDGSSAHRLFAYDEACACFTHTSEVLADPA